MSQQINLLLPELRPRFDWLGLPVVTGVVLAGLFLLFLIAQGQAMRLERSKNQEATIKGELFAMQQRLQSLAQSLSARQGNVDLPHQLAVAKAGVVQRQEVLTFVGQGNTTQVREFSGMFQGFARQSVNGVWLVGFNLAQSGIEIRGRLLDPALLPVYIGRLNADSAFTGRRFAALEMNGIDPATERREDSAAGKKPLVGGRYTEFVLRTDAASVEEKAP